MNRSRPQRTVWFHRTHEGLTGGQLKHADYFDHVRRTDGFAPKIVFANAPPNAAAAQQRHALWQARDGELVADWEPRAGDLLFLAGVDWRYEEAQGLGACENPRVNLIQGVQHVHRGTELRGYLARRAIRICVSTQVADAIQETGLVNGPVVTIPNGIDVATLPVERQTPIANRERSVLVVGYKRPELAAQLCKHLQEEGIPHIAASGFVARSAFLRLLAESAVVVCLPLREEGFYLPALEAMAAGCVTVTLDGVGNRGFCKHRENCLVARDDAASLTAAIHLALAMPTARREKLLRAAKETVARHTLAVEREKFQSVLASVDDLWRSVPSKAASGGAAVPSEPLLDFAIVGAQKSGTTALRQFLSAHPDIAMCPEEVHLFDSPEYSPGWTRERIDARYRRELGGAGSGCLRGECTPVYMFLPDVPAELQRYNPRLKLLVLLRDPVERAISAYYMERGRGTEDKPLWLALLLEPWRCWFDKNPRSLTSALRQHAYRRRGLYSRQLRRLFRHFSRNQVLVVRNEELRESHDAVLRRVFAFLEVRQDVRVPPESVFAGDGVRKEHGVARLLLRWTYRLEKFRLASLLRGGQR